MSSSFDKTDCPNTEVLAQLASGSLAEQQALPLFDHLEKCESCQREFDEFGNQAYGIFQAAAEQNDDVSTFADPEKLQSLIRRAQQLEAQSAVRKQPASKKSQAVSRDDFIEAFRRCGLLSSEEVELCLNEIDTDQDVDASDSSSLAKVLIQRRKLTHFQARVLLKGKWKGLVLGKYAILDRIGKGGMGDVFKAIHTGMDRIVCLKIVNSSGRQSPQVIDRFRNEAKALAALSHPNIVVAHDADESRGIPFLVMEYVEGNDLAKTVRSQGPLSVEDALQVTQHVANALEYAHGQGVIHRDIKPHNVVLTHDPNTGQQIVKVLDLGLARFDSMLTDNPDASLLAAMTNTGVVIGTVDYMSPEQALDSRIADVRSDIYSLGCMFYFLLTGRPPFDGNTVMQRLVAHREQPIPSLQDVGVYDAVQFQSFFQQMLSKDPEGRYQSMADVSSDLGCLARGEPISGQSAPEVDSIVQPKPEKDRKLWRFAIAVATVALTLATFFAMIPPDFFEGGLYAHSNKSKLRANFENDLNSIAGKRYGRDRAIKNGGRGRAFLIVSSERFNTEHYVALSQELRERQIELVLSSPGFGQDNEPYEMELRQSNINVSFDEFHPDDFDVLFFIGGETDDLTKESPRFHDQVKQIVQQSLQHGLNISSVGNGWKVIQETGHLKSAGVRMGSLVVHRANNTRSFIQRVQDADDIGLLVAKSFDNLLEDDQSTSLP